MPNVAGNNGVPWQHAASVVYAFAGGFADATGYLLVRPFTGHLTGNLILLALSFASPHRPHIVERVLAVVTFLIATAFCFQIAQQRERLAPWLLFCAQTALIGGISLPFDRQSRHHIWCL